MKFTFIESEHDLASEIAAKILRTAANKPDAFFMLATGKSPTFCYNKVADSLKSDRLALKSVKIHKLDEWEGLGSEHEQSCESYLNKYVLGPWGIDRKNYSGVDATKSDLNEECRKANDILDNVAPDICILGIGVNGHIGFNEPADSLPAYTAIVNLAATSMQHPMIKGAGSIKRGITTGIGQILKSKKIIVIVTGENKKEVLKTWMETTEISTQFPASLLLAHNDVEVFYDVTARS